MKRTFLSTLIAACLTLGTAGTINVASGLVAPTTAHAGVLGKIKGAVKSVGHHVKKAGGAVMRTGQNIGNKVGPLAVGVAVGKGALAAGKAVGKGAVAVGKGAVAVGKAAGKAVGKGAVAAGKAVGGVAVKTAGGLKTHYNRIKP
jgi:hypothetical protein